MPVEDVKPQQLQEQEWDGKNSREYGKILFGKRFCGRKERYIKAMLGRNQLYHMERSAISHGSEKSCLRKNEVAILR